MKTVKHAKLGIVRVSNEKAATIVKEGGQYVPKSLWKNEVRDINKKKLEK